VRISDKQQKLRITEKGSFEK